jgi:hypothetical protein
MKVAITLLGDEPVRHDPSIEAEYHLSGEPIFPVTIDPARIRRVDVH